MNAVGRRVGGRRVRCRVAATVVAVGSDRGGVVLRE